MAILDEVPDVSRLVAASSSLQGSLSGLSATLDALGPDDAGSPLRGVSESLATLRVRLDVDTSPLTTGLSGTLRSLQDALPANALSYVESIDQAYSGVASLLGESAIAREVGAGRSLQEAAEAVIEDALRLLDTRVGELSGQLIDPELLDALRGVLADIARFQDDYAAHRADFLPFLARQLAGVEPTFLDAPLAHVERALGVLAPLDEAALASALAPGRRAVVAAYRGLLDAISHLDPADAAGYASIQARLNELSAANDLLIAALSSLYQQVSGLIAGHDWGAIFSAYADLLAALTLPRVPTLGDVVRLLQQFLDELLARFHMVFNADELRERIELLTRSLRDAVLGSPLGQVRQALRGFLEDIREAIEAVPTEAVRAAVEGILRRAEALLAELPLSELQSEISEALAGAERFVAEQINTTLLGNVQAALAGLANQLNGLPIADLIADLGSALAQLQTVVANLEAAVQSKLDGLESLLAQLDDLSFRPVGDEVVGEIDQLKTRLAAINPNALSDVERLALQAALAVLQEIDLKGRVAAEIRSGYHAAEGEVKGLLDQVTAALTRLRDQFGALDPAAILQPVNDLLDGLSAQIERLNGQTLLAPLYGQLRDLETTLQGLQPGRLLDPLQPPFDTLMATLDRLDPAEWVAPLNTLYDQIDRLIDLVDITPLLDHLDRRQRELFASIRQAILSAFDGLSLPEPLDTFLGRMRPILDLITEALFGDPESELKQVSLALGERVRLGSLFEPMDELYLRLVGLLESVPADDLTTAANTLRQSLGIGLEVLDPRAILDRLRAGYGRLQDVAPATMLAQTLSLPALRASFHARVATAPAERAADVAAVSARFDVVFGVVSPAVPNNQLQRLTAQHASLLDSLRGHVNDLDRGPASRSYAQLRGNLERLLPDFLRQPETLTHGDVLAGLYGLRPSTRAAEVEETLSRFLLALEPVTATIEPAVNGFFALLREVASLISPLAVKEAVADIYETIREKVRVLDPDQLADSISALFAPLRTALQALSPAAIKAQLDEAYQRVVRAVSGTVRQVLDQLVAIVNAQLRAIRNALQSLAGQVRAAIAAALGSVQRVLEQLEDLVFVEVLGRLIRVVDNLGTSFDRELDRVLAAFDEMLAAIPLASSGSGAAVGVGTG